LSIAMAIGMQSGKCRGCRYSPDKKWIGNSPDRNELREVIARRTPLEREKCL